MRRPLPLSLAQRLYTPQVTHHILGLPKVHLLQQIPHPRLHILDHPPNIDNMPLLHLRLPQPSQRQILLRLPRQIPRQLQTLHARTLQSQIENDRRSQLILRRPLRRTLPQLPRRAPSGAVSPSTAAALMLCKIQGASLMPRIDL